MFPEITAVPNFAVVFLLYLIEPSPEPEARLYFLGILRLAF